MRGVVARVDYEPVLEWALAVTYLADLVALMMVVSAQVVDDVGEGWDAVAFEEELGCQGATSVWVTEGFSHEHWAFDFISNANVEETIVQ